MQKLSPHALSKLQCLLGHSVKRIMFKKGLKIGSSFDYKENQSQKAQELRAYLTKDCCLALKIWKSLLGILQVDFKGNEILG